MDDPLTQLGKLAAAAITRAKQLAIDLVTEDHDSIPRLDRLLQHERRLVFEQQQTAALPLADCYGAWLGDWVVRRLGGRWIGIHEPVPPRVDVDGLVLSPIDAVRRILVGAPAAATITEIARQLTAWRDRAARDREQADRFNRAAWDRLDDDRRFVATGTYPPDRSAALAAIDPWLRDEPLVGREVLCLAAGGGLHGPLFAIAGAHVTVLDLSPIQLDHDRRFCDKTGITMRLIEGSLTRLDELEPNRFDLIVQPVSSSYIADLTPMFAAIATTLRPGGIYVSQHKHPASLQIGFEPLDEPSGGGYPVSLPLISGLRLPAASGGCAEQIREPGAAEFLHSIDAILGGICRAGMVIEAVAEPPRGDAFAPPGSAEHRAIYAPTYLKVKARHG